MKKCVKCGADIQGNVRYCPYCGEDLNDARNAYSGPEYRRYRNDNYTGGYSPGTAYSDGFDPRDIEDNRIIAVLCYFGILLLIPLLARPYSQYVKYHSNQGLLLLLFTIALGAVGIVPIIGWIISFVGGIFSFICLILGIVHTLNGKAVPLPIIGKYTILH